MSANLVQSTIESEILILGGGCSGWSLVAALMDQDLHEKYQITIVEKPGNELNKTWSFWENLPHSRYWHPEFTWDNLRFNLDPTFSTSFQKNTIYQSIDASKFVELIKKTAFESGKIKLIEDDIIDCDFLTTTAKSSTSTYKAKVVFQNFFSNKKEEKQLIQSLEYPLLQHFKGFIIESDSLDLPSKEALFMDFEVNQSYGFAFMYVLPYSKTKALFEYTLFSEKVLEAEKYEEETYAYIARKYKLTKPELNVISVESGAIPMNDMLPSVSYNHNWFKMGSITGMTKASTGYTFARIQKACTAVANSIMQYGLTDLVSIKAQLQKGTSSTRYRLYDIILLELLKSEPNEVIIAFKQLFRKVGIEKMLRFLSEDQSILADFAVLNSVDKTTFVKAIWRARKVLIRHLFY